MLHSKYSTLMLTGVLMLLASFHIPVKKHEVIHFSGYDWIVKGDKHKVGPGPNHFSSDNSNVWVDEQGRLHLKITKEEGRWRCAEVLTKHHLGYGTYIFKVEGRLDHLDRNIVFGMFTWDSDPDRHHREMDIEISAWGKKTGPRLSFAVQPGEGQDSPWKQEGTHTMHMLKWEPGFISFASYHGHVIPDTMCNPCTVKRAEIPEGKDTRTHINLWLFKGNAPSDGQEAEVIIKSFEFIPFK